VQRKTADVNISVRMLSVRSCVLVPLVTALLTTAPLANVCYDTIRYDSSVYRGLES